MTRTELKNKDWSGEHFCTYHGKEYRIIQVDLVEDLIGLLLPDNFEEDDFELTWVRCESVQMKGEKTETNFTANFQKPTDEQICEAAIIFNEGKIEMETLTKMVSLADFVIDRLYENGDITIPSSKESE